MTNRQLIMYCVVPALILGSFIVQRVWAQDRLSPFWGMAVILPECTDIVGSETLKGPSQKPVSIEAIYTVSQCARELTSIRITNAHFPITWYELNDAGQRIHVLFNPQLSHFNDQTTYIVEDFSQNTDTIYIEFNKSLAVNKVYPNPHRDMLHLEYSAMEATEMKIRIYDISGKLIRDHFLILYEGQHEISYHPGNLRQGIYFISLEGLCIKQLHTIIHLL